ncbi:expressed unknown protein [Seminavis robusta]|uniref:gamma-glutamylcyclotransferase n=1 Tax=Seminavis robusta TaxID=568900 RepID=A0A9N8HTC9_9STRA|nr:expressed unknown protein [Seminavis robusta]|eukprot:Sro1644_g288180.1 n/a (467) ;mRNA; f:11682-13082
MSICSSLSSSCSSLSSSSFSEPAVAEAATPDYHCHDDSSIYYFGYGALVNPMARQRRGVKTCQAQAASLPDYRLTFAVAGAANICQQQGWECHGILMKCASPQDFETLKAFDTGYDCIAVQVFPYHDYWNDSDDAATTKVQEDNQTKCGYRNSLHGKQSITANVFVMHADPEKNEALPMDRLPQERYLRVIAAGMKSYGVDEGYIEEEIMGVPYIPSRKPHEYLTFPPAQADVPEMSLVEWNHYCHERLQHEAKPLILIRLGSTVIQLQDYNVDNPFCTWLHGRMMGPHDATWVLMQTLLDPDLTPRITSPDQVAAPHHAWAENQLMEKFEQAGLHTATTIVRVQLSQTTPCVQCNYQQQQQQQLHRSSTALSTNSSITTTSSTQLSLLLTDESQSEPADNEGRQRKQKNKLLLSRNKSSKSHSKLSSMRSSLRSSLHGLFVRRSSRESALTTSSQQRQPLASSAG